MLASLSLALAFFGAHASHVGAVTCSPPTILTGCTEDDTSGLNVTASVPLTGTAPPTITTDSATGITDTTATVSGIMTADGGAPSSVEGFNYGTSMAYDTTTLNSGSFTVGPFSAMLTGLLCATEYHFQAYATNPQGTGMGGDMTFTTADCPVVAPPVPSPDDNHSVTTSSTVNFSGTAYPGAHVVILKDGVVVIASTAAANGTFEATVAGIDMGSYVFSAYAQDTAGRFSASYSFPFYINGHSIVNISGILIAPTIAESAAVVNPGAKVTIVGQSAPDSVVNIILDGSKEQNFSTLADANGLYSYGIDTTGFADPAYQVRVESLFGGQSSPFSKTLRFILNGITLPNGQQQQATNPPAGGFCGAGQGDLNCDGHVNIIDYSIMKYWYGRANPPVIVDLSGDGQITLKDFSILASDWTG